MRTTKNLHITKKLFLLLFALIFAVACKQSNNENLPVLDIEDTLHGVTRIDDGFHYYNYAECNFLAGSSSLNPEDIQNIYCSGNDLYLLFPDRLLYYDLNSGDLLNSFRPADSTGFVDFTFIPSTQRAYILDNMNSQVVELGTDGVIINTIKLEKTHSYAAIKRLDDKTFLVPAQTVPKPLFFSVNFETDDVKQYDFPGTGKTNDVSSENDSVGIKYPLYVADEVQEGVLVKYLFDDKVYLCTANEAKAEYLMNMGKEKVKLKYPWSKEKLKNNDRLRIIRFWHAQEKKYILRQGIVGNTRGVFDTKTLSQFEGFELFDGISGFIALTKIASLIPNYDEIFMDADRTRFLGFKKLRKEDLAKKDIWPEQMLNAENEDNLVVSIFTMKQEK